MIATNSYSRYCVTGKDQDEVRAKIVDERTAALDDGTLLRRTPKDQKTVAQLVFPGDTVKSNYSEKRYIVVNVSQYEVYGLPVYSLSLADEDAERTIDGYYRRRDCEAGINELVAQDDRILQLFYAGEDEVYVLEHSSSSFQSQLFGLEIESLIEPYKPQTRKATITVKKTTSKTKCAYTNPFYCIDSKCEGCSCSCGSGCCVQNLSEIDAIVQREIKHLTTCSSAKRMKRTIKISIEDFRKEKQKELI